MKVMEIEGIGEVFAEKLRLAGIQTVEVLLERGRTRKGRAELATATGLPEATLLEWVNHADLMRIHGVGPEYADLLEAVGVDTVPELAQRNPTNLHTAILSLLETKELVRRPPSEGMIGDWVAEAGRLGRTIEF